MRVLISGGCSLPESTKRRALSHAGPWARDAHTKAVIVVATTGVWLVGCFGIRRTKARCCGVVILRGDMTTTSGVGARPSIKETCVTSCAVRRCHAQAILFQLAMARSSICWTNYDRLCLTVDGCGLECVTDLRHIKTSHITV